MATLQADRTFWGEAQAKILKRVSSTIDQNLNGFPHIGRSENRRMGNDAGWLLDRWVLDRGALARRERHW